jgi:hypothetical protein
VLLNGGWLAAYTNPEPKEARMRSKTAKTIPAPRQPLASTVPPTPAEEQVAAADWERRGLLDRLVRR